MTTKNQALVPYVELANIIPEIKSTEMYQNLIKRMSNFEVSETGCHEWQGRKIPVGYGVIGIGHRRQEGTHRVAWIMKNGAIPDGICVLHKCDNRKCINPDHLILGTKKENTTDMVEKGRHYSHGRTITHCPQGHIYTGKTNNKGSRICQECQSARSLKWYHSTKGEKSCQP